MPNDLSTLNGSLVEMKDQLIYELGQKGVTASYDSSTGLLGLIGKISEIQTGGSCYHIEFSEDSYTATGGAVTLECTLQQNYAPLPNVSVSLSDGSSVYSSITNSQGIATFTLTGLISSGTWTCSYNNVTDTCNVIVMNYLIYDDASVDNSSTLFGSYISLRNKGTNTVTYDSSTPCYVLKNTRSSSESFRSYTALDGYTGSFKMIVRSKCTSSSACPISLYYYLDSNNWGGVKDEHANIWISSKTNGSFTESNKGGTNHLTSELTDEFIYDSTSNTLTINRYYNGSLEHTQVMNIPVTLNSNVKWGTTLSWDNNATCEVYEIIAEPI